MPDGFWKRRPLDGALTSPAQIVDRLLREAGLLEVVRHQFGLRFEDLGKLRLERVGDVAVKLLTFASQETAIRRILHEGVLEYVGGIRRLAAAIDEIGSCQLRERGIERARRHRRERGKQPIGEFATDSGPDLRNLLDRREPVQTRHQRIMEGDRNRRNGDRALKNVSLANILKHAGFEDRLGHFLDKQRNPVGLADDDLRNFGGQPLAGSEVDEHCADFVAA